MWTCFRSGRAEPDERSGEAAAMEWKPASMGTEQALKPDKAGGFGQLHLLLAQNPVFLITGEPV